MSEPRNKRIDLTKFRCAQIWQATLIVKWCVLMMVATKNKIAEIEGLCIHPNYRGRFTGEILLELRKDYVYYTWTVRGIEGGFSGQVSMPDSFKVMPADANPFEYALNHAIVGINKYRMNRRSAFQVENWQWKILPLTIHFSGSAKPQADFRR